MSIQTQPDAADGADDRCPVCDEPYNHVIKNGYRNTWPTTKVAVCTTENTDHMWVHVTGHD